MNILKLRITTLVLIEDVTDRPTENNICFHSFEEDIEKAKEDIMTEVNELYADLEVSFDCIEDLYDYFDYYHIETREVTFLNPKLTQQ